MNEGTNDVVKKYRVSTKWFTYLKLEIFVILALIGILIYNVVNTSKIVVLYEKQKIENRQLTKQNANYEELLTSIDSIWILEDKIQNIFQTYLENDSEKINNFIDRNRFEHEGSEKNAIDFERTTSWKSPEARKKQDRIPNVIPVTGVISQKFSKENKHLSVDFSAQMGNPVFSAGSGIVEFAGQKSDLGNTIIVNHQNGYITKYSHLKDIKVTKGRAVRKGEIIGSVGMSGNANGPHLHYTITLNGKEIDPEILFNY